MMAATYGYEHYERAQGYFADEAYLEAARELEELFTDLAEAGHDTDASSAEVAGHGLSEARLLLARSYYHSAQLTRAEKAARAVIAEDPQDAYAHLLLGRTLERAGRIDEARGPLRLAELLGDYGNEDDGPSGTRVSDAG